MKYNFDALANRRNTDSLKWDVEENELPMWVADMDFKTCPDVVNAIEKRMSIQAYGYSIISDDWYNSIINWWKHYNLDIKKDNLIFSTGVVASISALVNRITNIGDNILLITPTYNIFYNCVLNHGRHILECELDYIDNEYSLDFKLLEKKLSNPLTTMLILCNPQNPIGRIWKREELKQIGLLCNKHHVVVVSDEVHCDLTISGTSYTPFASVDEICKNNSITLISPSKTFNLAGLHTAGVIVYNKRLYNITYRTLNSYEIAEPNFFAINAAIAAYTKGREWVDELRKYIDNNRKIVTDYINDNIKDITLIKSNATYLLWLDCSSITNDSVELQKFIRKNTGLYLSDGEEYHGNGKFFLRMNIGTSKENVLDGLKRLKNGIELYKKRELA